MDLKRRLLEIHEPVAERASREALADEARRLFMRSLAATMLEHGLSPDMVKMTLTAPGLSPRAAAAHECDLADAVNDVLFTMPAEVAGRPWIA